MKKINLLCLFSIFICVFFVSCANNISVDDNPDKKTSYNVTVFTNREQNPEQFSGAGEYKPGDEVKISMNWTLAGEFFVGYYDQYFNLISESSTCSFYMPDYDVNITAYHYKEGDKPLILGDVAYFGMYPQSMCSSVKSEYYSKELPQNYSEYNQFEFYINNMIAEDLYFYHDYNLEIPEKWIHTKFRYVKYDPNHIYSIPLRLSDCTLEFPETIQRLTIDSETSTWSIFQNLIAYNYENGFLTGNHYIYEPIKWRVLSNSNGKAFIMSDKVIDSQQFYHSKDNRIIDGKTVYPNDWEHSDIRKWLNNDFYKTAFTKGCDKYILETSLDNINTAKQPFQTGDDSHLIRIGKNESTENQNNTVDKVFLPSAKDCCNTSYGFKNDNDGWDSARKFIPTDYAKLMGIRVDYGNYNYGDEWGAHPEAFMKGYATHVWTRSGIKEGYFYIGNDDTTDHQGVLTMDNFGDLEQTVVVTKTCVGIVPAITVSYN